MTSERIRDRWEVKACETCGFERHVLVSYLRPDNPSWSRDCDVCDARWRLRKAQARVAKAEEHLHKLMVKRGKEVERRKKKPLDRTPREELVHVRHRFGLEKSEAWCRRQGTKLKYDDPDRANCKKCKKAHDTAQETPDASSDHLLP